MARRLDYARGAAAAALAAGAWVGFGAAARAEEAPVDALRNLTIEQLANLEVTSVSRRPENVNLAPAAIEVITAEDIRRSGAQALPEALRLARNLEVARIDAQRYAISARGFNSFEASNKLLVLIDGRSVYTPLYSGVFWDQQRVALADVDRIEVISGPGGTLWGANAVNGVINVISRSSAETQGWLAQASVGEPDRRVDLRYGGAFGANAHYRIYASGVDRDSAFTTVGADAGDEWGGLQTGVRADWGDLRDSFTFDAGTLRDYVEPAGTHTGAHALGRWRRLLSDGSTFEAQTYYSRAARQGGGVQDELETWDIEFEHHMASMGRHDVVWGGGYRLADSTFTNDTGFFGFASPERTLTIGNIFAQDEIALRDDLALTVGLKLEYNTFTDLEYMPNVRLAWRPSERDVLWAAVSRAVRTPSRIDRELEAPNFIIAGGFESETLVAYELGYRTQPVADLWLSANVYYHEYDKLRTSELTPPGVLPARVGNGLAGEVYGLEARADWAVVDNVRLSGGLTLLEQEFEEAPFHTDVNGSGDDPGYQVFFGVRTELSDDIDFDIDVRAIDEVAPQVPAYVEANARVAWRATDELEFALIGENLFDESHPEAVDAFQREVRRGLYLSARLSY